MKRHYRQSLIKLIPSLVINWLIPIVLYSFLRSYVATDTVALAISGAVPTLWVMIQMFRIRRIDWIGLLGAAGFGAACFISFLSGGESLPIKLYHPIVACLIGVIALVSVVIQKPLGLVLIRSLKIGNPGFFNSPAARRKFTLATVIFGMLLIVDGIIHVIMALSLSTSVFLIWSKIVSLIMAVILFFAVRHILWQKT